MKLNYNDFRFEARHSYDKDELYPIYEQLLKSMEAQIKTYTYTYVPISSVNKCQREYCNFKVHTNFKNNGGTHCCKSCKAGKLHGPACQRQPLV